MRASSLLAAALGVLLLGFDARWTSEPLRFAASWAGAELGSLDRAALLDLAAARAPLLHGLALGVGVLLGLLARVAGASRAVAIVAGALTWAALDPGTLGFVARRGAESAERYLDVGDVVRGTGVGFLVLAALLAARGEGAARTRSAGGRTPRSVLVACLVAALLPAVLSRAVLGGEPVTNDGVAYRFQAELFAAGETAREVGELAPFFPARQVMPGERAFSKYPPGHSAVLAPGALVGLPELLPWILAAFVPWLVWWLARRFGSTRPELAAWLVSLSPAVLGVQTLWLSHGTAVPCTLAFAAAACAASDAVAAGERGRASRLGVLGGLAIGLAFAARPLTAVAFALPFLAWWFGSWVARRDDRLGPTVATLVGALPPFAFFLWINHDATGAATTTAYQRYAELVSPNDRWGLANAATALPYTRYNLARAGVWVHGFAPALLLVVLGFRGRLRAPWLLASPALSLLAAYALHRFQGIPWVGPLYLVEAVPLLAVLSAEGLGVVAGRSRVAIPAALGGAVVGAALLLVPHLRLASEEAALRRAPRELARQLLLETGAERVVVFCQLPDEAAVKRYPLPPPSDGARVVLARDLGPANAALLDALGDPPARRWRAGTDRLEPLAN